MSLNRRAVFAYLAAVLIPLAIGSQWGRLFPTFQLVPGYVYLLVVALAARFLGFGPAIASIVTSVGVLAVWILYRLFPAEESYLRLLLFLAASVVIAGISRRGSEQAREADERYRGLVELSPDGISVTDEAGKIVFANSALAKMVGANDAASLIGRNALDFLPPEDHEPARSRLKQLISGEPTPWVRSRAIKLDGSIAQIERAGVPLRTGNRVYAQGFIRDVTEREESRRRLQALFDTAIDGILFIDTSGRFVDANPAASELLGSTHEEILKMNVGDVGPQDRRETLLAIWRDAIAGRKMSGEWTLHSKNGSVREMEYRIVTNVLPGLHCTLLHDITARKEAERSLAQLSARLLRSQDQERRRIARQLHDTTAQNLAALRLNLSRISRSADPGIKNSVDDSIALTDQSIMEIRTLSYLLHPPLIDEAGLLPSLRWLTRGFEERSGIKVTLDAPEELDRLPGELETAVFRVVQEALTNIQRHSGSAFAHICLKRDHENVRLVIEDGGSGLPKHLRDQGEAALAAAGVGIAGMLQRVRELGGNMQIESEDTGMRIDVTLPIPEGS